ncbi:hypothetical protein BDR04DRAFT_359010 [Suillus decipiens]|nr:hypothetical protein BDR04DRAFT_359010 [Suillus decipiens]
MPTPCRRANTERLMDVELLGQMDVMVFAILDTTASVLASLNLSAFPIPALKQDSGTKSMIPQRYFDSDMSSAELPYDVPRRSSKKPPVSIPSSYVPSNFQSNLPPFSIPHSFPFSWIHVHRFDRAEAN